MSKRETIADESHQALPYSVWKVSGHSAKEPSTALTELSDGELAIDTSTDEQELVDLACSMYETRRLRARFLSVSILGEPVWDMLLALYCFTARGEALSVTGLCHAAEVPPTTALRWLQLLEQKNLVSRSKDLHDGRRAFIMLSPEGKDMMTDYLAAAQKRMAAEVHVLADPAAPPIA